MLPSHTQFFHLQINLYRNVGETVEEISFSLSFPENITVSKDIIILGCGSPVLKHSGQVTHPDLILDEDRLIWLKPRRHDFVLRRFIWAKV